MVTDNLFLFASGDLPWGLHGVAATHLPALPLKASEAALEAPRRLLEGAALPPYVGVAWRAGLSSRGSAEHLLKTVTFEPPGAALRQAPGKTVSPQRNAPPDELASLPRVVARPAFDAEGVNADLDARPGLLARHDECAGASGTNVHLRASLGEPARVLIPLPPEWRPGRSGPQTPWFPGFRLYREDRERGWTGAIEGFAADLRGRHGAR